MGKIIPAGLVALLIAVSILPHALGATSQDYWVRIYGLEDDDSLNSATIAPNGDIIAAGQFTYLGKVFPALIRVDRYGKLLWAKVYTTNRTIYRASFERVKVGESGEIFVLGELESASGDSIVVMKLDESGNIAWERELPSDNVAVPISLVPLPNGEVAVSAYFGSLNSVVVVKFNPYGDIAWAGKITGSNVALFSAMTYAEGKILLAASINGNDVGIMEISPSGKVLSSKTLSSTSLGEVVGVEANSKGIFLAGTVMSGQSSENRPWVVLIANGTPMFLNVYDGGMEAQGEGIAVSPEGNAYLLASLGNITNRSTWLVGIDESGNVLLSKTYRIGSTVHSYGVASGPEFLALSGSIKLLNAGDEDGFLLRLPYNGNAPDVEERDVQTVVQELTGNVTVKEGKLGLQKIQLRSKSLDFTAEDVCIPAPLMVKVTPDVQNPEESGGIYVNGEYAMPLVNPALLRLCPGTYTIEVQREGFYPFEETVRVESGVLYTVEALLTPKPKVQNGKLEVESEPPGAGVYLNGTFLGTTPLSVDVAPGTYSITVTKEGHQEYTETVRISSGEKVKLSLELKPLSSTTTSSPTSTTSSTVSTKSTSTTSHQSETPSHQTSTTSTKSKGGWKICGPGFAVLLSLLVAARRR